MHKKKASKRDEKSVSLTSDIALHERKNCTSEQRKKKALVCKESELVEIIKFAYSLFDPFCNV